MEKDAAERHRRRREGNKYLEVENLKWVNKEELDKNWRIKGK